ncbi:MAG TPA: hypothetical protein VI754_15885 [Bacteriovoracaceae bacterium]|nr:hypothetical protein [Bacteriovoracaceae bacterium]
MTKPTEPNTSQNTKSIISYLKEALELNEEITAVEQLSQFTESIGNKLIKLYDLKFPKKCNTCGRVYQTRNEYLKATNPIKGRTGTVFAKNSVQEYRNCICGSTLIVITEERRDTSSFGNARRALFDLCLEKLKSFSKKDESELKNIIRNIFRTVIEQSQQNQNGLEDIKYRDL